MLQDQNKKEEIMVFQMLFCELGCGELSNFKDLTIFFLRLLTLNITVLLLHSDFIVIYICILCIQIYYYFVSFMYFLFYGSLFYYFMFCFKVIAVQHLFFILLSLSCSISNEQSVDCFPLE